MKLCQVLITPDQSLMMLYPRFIELQDGWSFPLNSSLQPFHPATMRVALGKQMGGSAMEAVATKHQILLPREKEELA